MAAVSVLARSGYPLERVIAEVARCDVRCTDCHRIRTHAQRDWRGAPEGIRTPNLLIRSQMLYPLSYGRTASRPGSMLQAGGRPPKTDDRRSQPPGVSSLVIVTSGSSTSTSASPPK